MKITSHRLSSMEYAGISLQNNEAAAGVVEKKATAL